MYCRVFSSIPGLYPQMSVNCPFSDVTQICLPTLPNVPREESPTWLRTTSLSALWKDKRGEHTAHAVTKDLTLCLIYKQN